MSLLRSIEDYKDFTVAELNDLAAEEVVADGMELILTDGKVLSELANTDKSLWNKVKEWITDIISKIKKYYGELSGASKTAQVLRETMDSLDEIERLFIEAVQEAGERTRTAETTTEINGGGQKMSISAEYSQEIDEWSRDGKPVSESFVLGMTGDVLQGLGAIESEIYINGDKIKSILKEHPEMTLEEIKKIPQILEDPVLILKSKNVGRAGQMNSRMVIFGAVKAENGQPVMSVLDLHPTENNFTISDMQKVTSAYTKTTSPVQFVKDSFVVYADKKRTASLLRSIGFQTPIKLNKSGYIGSISYKGRSVNIFGKNFSEVFDEEEGKRYSLGEDADEAYLSAVKRGDMETAQRMVDEAAKAAGYTIKAYHGTNAEFTVFDARKSRVGAFGKGFYLSPSKANAGMYGSSKIIESYVALQNPYVVEDSLGLDYDTLQKMQDDLGESQRITDKSAMAVLKTHGYDGIVVMNNGRIKEFVVYDSKKIKSADPVTYDDAGNVIPLSDRFNERSPDIRYSLGDAENGDVKGNEAEAEPTDRELLAMALEGAVQSEEYKKERRGRRSLRIILISTSPTALPRR